MSIRRPRTPPRLVCVRSLVARLLVTCRRTIINRFVAGPRTINDAKHKPSEYGYHCRFRFARAHRISNFFFFFDTTTLVKCNRIPIHFGEWFPTGRCCPVSCPTVVDQTVCGRFFFLFLIGSHFRRTPKLTLLERRKVWIIDVKVCAISECIGGSGYSYSY